MNRPVKLSVPFLTISEIADQLHVTERTLRRRLVDEATNFRTIFDEIRNVLAQNYLSKTSLSVVEIADLLNYTEAAIFIEPSSAGIQRRPANFGGSDLREDYREDWSLKSV